MYETEKELFPVDKYFDSVTLRDMLVVCVTYVLPDERL
jgi:hypothetical protein